MGALIFKNKKEKLATNVKSLFDISAVDIDGQEHVLADLAKGYKCIMVVNVATNWGMTKTNYKQMVKIHNEFSDKGFQIFAFPCNQFMGQEPGTEEKIKKFATEKYGAKFQLFSKVNVNGPDTHEVYKFCRQNSPLFDPKSEKVKNIPWNFTKFLIDGEGQVIEYYHSKTEPNVIVPRIEEMLKE